MPSLPTAMTAVAIRGAGGPEMLVPEQRPVPQPGAGEILIAVAAAGVNRPDVMQRKGLYPPPPGAPDIPGLEIAGDVIAVGDGVGRWKPGDRVMALVSGGGYAPYCVAHGDHALAVPAGLSMVEAAAIPETFFTVWSNLFDRGGPQERRDHAHSRRHVGHRHHRDPTGERLRRPRDCDRRLRREMRGVPQARSRSRHQLQDPGFRRRDQGGDRRQGADVILDMIAGDYVDRNYEAAAMDGRIVQIAVQGGPKATVNITRLMLKRLTHTGSTLRARPILEKAAIARMVETNVGPLLASGRVKPVIFRAFPLVEAAAAHALMESSQHIGKIVLTI